MSAAAPRSFRLPHGALPGRKLAVATLASWAWLSGTSVAQPVVSPASSAPAAPASTEPVAGPDSPNPDSPNPDSPNPDSPNSGELAADSADVSPSTPTPPVANAVGSTDGPAPRILEQPEAGGTEESVTLQAQVADRGAIQAVSRRADFEEPRAGGWTLGLNGEFSDGALTDFQNVGSGLRLAYRFSSRVSFGGYVGWVNLPGHDGRTNNVLPYFHVEYRAPLRKRWALPLRFGTGYLPRNGPYLRAGPALVIPFGKNTDLLVDAFVPSVWVTQNRTEYALSYSAELCVRL